MKIILKKFLKIFLNKFKRDDIIVVHLPFISVFNNLKLQLFLGQIPWVPKNNKPSFIKKNTHLRENLKKNFLFKEKKSYKKISC